MSGQHFHSWTLGSHVEPTIRVGIALPRDAMQAIRLTIPNLPYRVSADDPSGEEVRGMEAEAVDAEVIVEGSHVRFQAVSSVGRGELVRLVPRKKIRLKRGSGVQLQGVVTGRGFHWEKRVAPTMAGALEFRAQAGRLLVVNELPLEDYLAGVISGEMSGDCPLAFLQSQCLVARSWVLAHTENKHADLPIDRCNDDCCQRYHGTSDLTPTVLEAVRSTRGQVLVDPDDRIIDANYSKSCGGIVESPQHVWGVPKPGQRATVDAPGDSEARRFFPLVEAHLREYLTGDWLERTDVFCSPNVVPDADLPNYLGKVDDGGGHFRWRMEYRREELEAILRQKFFAARKAETREPMETLIDLRVVRRGESGRATELEIVYLDPAGTTHRAAIVGEYAIRDCLHEKFLYSSALWFEVRRRGSGVPTDVTLLGAGWGHGAGLCQIGALGMALKGYDAESIVRHYFEPIRIHACY